MYISKFQREMDKKLVVSELIVSKLVALKLSLLRREYLSSALKVLTNCLKILRSTKRNFLQLILVHRDQ